MNLICSTQLNSKNIKKFSFAVVFQWAQTL